jgi:hypothetical protein
MQVKHYIAGLVCATLALIGVNNFIPTKTHAQLGAVQTWAGTAGGTASAITLTVHNVAALNDLLGVPIRFIPSNNSVGTTTLAITLDSGGPLTATAVLRPTANIGLQALSGSELVTGVMSAVTYDGTEFVVTSNVDMTPVGQSVDLRQSSTTAPKGYLLEDGTCQTQATYPALFTVVGSTYNAGSQPGSCSGTQFAVPYANGTASVALDTQGANTANRITSAGSGCTFTATGILCGSQNQTLTATQIPSITATSGSITITVAAVTGGINIPVNNSSIAQIFATGAGSTVPTLPASGGNWSFVSSLQGANTVNTSSNNTGGTSHPILQPMMGVRKAIKL